MRSWIAAAAVALLAASMPAAQAAPYWAPGTGAAPDTHHYTICDMVRQFCYDLGMELVTPVLHEQQPYWVVRADMLILAGFPPDMEYPRGFVHEPWRMAGDPYLDIDLLDDSLPPGIPAMTFVLLYDGTAAHSPFVDHSRTLADSMADTIFGMDHIMAGGGPVRVGERWGDAVVAGSVDGLYVVEYVGEGSASWLIDPAKPMPLAGTYRADRYDPHVGHSSWFYADRSHMEILLGVYERAAVDVSGPDHMMRAGTLAGMTWSSDTYQVVSLSTSPDRATIRGLASGPGELHVVMPAFGGSYTFWQDGAMLEAEYGVAGGVLSAQIRHGSGSDIAIHAIPDDICTGDCLEGLVVRAWDGPAAIVYGNGFHGSVRMSLASGDPGGVAPSLCPPGSAVTVDFDTMEPRRATPALPHATTYESVLDVSISRDGSTIRAEASGGPAALTLRMPAMLGHVTYAANGSAAEPLAESRYHDTVTATLQHPGGTVSYVASADGPTAWKGGLALPPPADRTGAVWCGQSEPVNAAVIRDSGLNRQDCGVTKYDGGWNIWC